MPPFKGNKAVARTHADAVNIVCAVCWKKPKGVRSGQFHGKWENWRKQFFSSFELSMPFKNKIFGHYL